MKGSINMKRIRNAMKYWINDAREIVQAESRPDNATIITAKFESFNKAYDFRRDFYAFGCVGSGTEITHYEGGGRHTHHYT